MRNIYTRHLITEWTLITLPPVCCASTKTPQAIASAVAPRECAINKWIAITPRSPFPSDVCLILMRASHEYGEYGVMARSGHEWRPKWLIELKKPRARATRTLKTSRPHTAGAQIQFVSFRRIISVIIHLRVRNMHAGKHWYLTIYNTSLLILFASKYLMRCLVIKLNN